MHSTTVPKQAGRTNRFAHLAQQKLLCFSPCANKHETVLIGGIVSWILALTLSMVTEQTFQAPARKDQAGWIWGNAKRVLELDFDITKIRHC